MKVYSFKLYWNKFFELKCFFFYLFEIGLLENDDSDLVMEKEMLIEENGENKLMDYFSDL